MQTIQDHLITLKEHFLETFAYPIFNKGFVGIQRNQTTVLEMEKGEKINLTDTKGAYFYLVLPDFLTYDNSIKQSSCYNPHRVNYQTRMVFFAPKYDVYQLELAIRQWFIYQSNKWEMTNAEINKWDVYYQETTQDANGKNALEKTALLSVAIKGDIRQQIDKNCKIDLKCIC